MFNLYSNLFNEKDEKEHKKLNCSFVISTQPK